jgi:1-deoxy-D-xylulose-5-phosphate reductoisomerase
MRTPIQYALTFPERVASNRQRLQLQDVSRLEFQAPDEAKFPCLRLARQAYRAGGIHPAVLNAADEVAVDAFCAGRIAFTDIASVVAEVLDRIPGHAAAKVEAITQADTDARRVAEERIREKSGTRNPSI